jgi:hypothetical protein
MNRANLVTDQMGSVLRPPDTPHKVCRFKTWNRSARTIFHYRP